MPTWETIKPGNQDGSGSSGGGGGWETIVPPKVEATPQPADQNPIDIMKSFAGSVLGFGKSVAESTGIFSTVQDLNQETLDIYSQSTITTNNTAIQELMRRRNATDDQARKNRLMDAVKALSKENERISGEVGGKLKDKTDLQLQGQAVQTGIDLATSMPFGIGAKVAGELPSLAKLVWQGAKTGFGIGVPYGAAASFSEGKTDPIEITKQSIETGGQFALFGGGLSGAFGLLGRGLAKAFEGKKPAPAIESPRKQVEAPKTEPVKPPVSAKTPLSDVVMGKDEIVSLKPPEVNPDKPFMRDITPPKSKEPVTLPAPTVMTQKDLSVVLEPPKVFTKATIGEIPKNPELPKEVKIALAPADRNIMETFGKSVERKGGTFEVAGNKGVAEVPGRPRITFTINEGANRKDFNQVVGEIKAKFQEPKVKQAVAVKVQEKPPVKKVESAPSAKAIEKKSIEQKAREYVLKNKKKFREYNQAEHNASRDHARMLSVRLSNERQKAKPDKATITRLEKAIGAAEKEMSAIRSGGKSMYRVVKSPLLQEAGKHKSEADFISAKTGKDSSTFSDNTGSYSIDEAERFIKSDKPQPIEIPQSYLKSRIPEMGVDKKYAKTTDISQPGIVIVGKTSDGRTTYKLIDGWHRAAKSADEGKPFLAYPVPRENVNLSDLYNKAQGGEFRLSDDFEKATGIKITPAQEAEIMALNKKMFGDTNVKVTGQILTPEGQKALGVYQDDMIKILDGQANPKDTYYHEAVHKYLDVFLTADEHSTLLAEYAKLKGIDDIGQAEEQIGESFIQYAKSREGVTGEVKLFFDRIINRIKAVFGNENAVQSLYADILKTKKMKVATVPGEVAPSGIAKSINAKAIEAKLTTGFSEVAGYEKVSFQDQANKVVDLLNSDVLRARSIVRGDQALPEGMRGTSLVAGMEEYLKIHPNEELMYELANSPLISENSAAAQELGLSRMREQDSATAKLADIKRAREVSAGDITPARLKKDIKAETEKVNFAKEVLTWDNFISEIQC